MFWFGKKAEEMELEAAQQYTMISDEAKTTHTSTKLAAEKKNEASKRGVPCIPYGIDVDASTDKDTKTANAKKPDDATIPHTVKTPVVMHGNSDTSVDHIDDELIMNVATDFNRYLIARNVKPVVIDDTVLDVIRKQVSDKHKSMIEARLPKITRDDTVAIDVDDLDEPTDEIGVTAIADASSSRTKAIDDRLPQVSNNATTDTKQPSDTNAMNEDDAGSSHIASINDAPVDAKPATLSDVICNTGVTEVTMKSTDDAAAVSDESSIAAPDYSSYRTNRPHTPSDDLLTQFDMMRADDTIFTDATDDSTAGASPDTPRAAWSPSSSSSVSEDDVDALMSQLVDEVAEERRIEAIGSVGNEEYERSQAEAMVNATNGIASAIRHYVNVCGSLDRETMRATIDAYEDEYVGRAEDASADVHHPDNGMLPIDGAPQRHPYLSGKRDATWCDRQIKLMLRNRRSSCRFKPKRGDVDVLRMSSKLTLMQDTYVDALCRKYGILSYGDGDPSVTSQAMPFETRDYVGNAVSDVERRNDMHTFNVASLSELPSVLALTLYPMMKHVTAAWKDDADDRLMPYGASDRKSFRRDVLKPIVKGLEYQIVFEVSENGIRTDWYRSHGFDQYDIDAVEDRIAWHIDRAYRLIAANRQYIRL